MRQLPSSTYMDLHGCGSPGRGMGHCGVSIGVYGQDGAIIRVNADEMAWPKAQRSCTIPVPRQLPKEGNTATTIKPVCAYAWR